MRPLLQKPGDLRRFDGVGGGFSPLRRHSGMRPLRAQTRNDGLAVGWVEPLRNPSLCRGGEDGFRYAQPILRAGNISGYRVRAEAARPGMTVRVITQIAARAESAGSRR